ncbi:MAG TPA: CHAP domain-containing protein [Polyangia bacterium]|nr:CHAP domain-containing protein [Polyangia bacterium]
MGLPLPDERGRPRLLEVLLATLAVLGLSAFGCASPNGTRRLPASVFRGARFEVRGHRSAHRPRGDESAALVERTLHEAGLRFGTDGSVRALWGYMRTSQEVVAPSEARAGDVLFFDTRGTDDAPTCADHAGIVESVDGDGRLGFVEARDGQVRHSFVDPAHPTTRRGEREQILNSFLRPKRVSDPPEARYFAGEMLCGVARVRR